MIHAVRSRSILARFGGARPAAEERSFDQMYRHAAYPAALTDLTGRLLAFNPAMARAHDAAGLAGPPESAADLLAAWTDAPDPLVYRLANTALDGASHEPVLGPQGRFRIGARRAGDGLVWTVAPLSQPRRRGSAPDAADALLDRLPVALARLSPQGRIEFLNQAARVLLGPRAEPGIELGDVVEGLGRSMTARLSEALRGDSTGRADLARVQDGDREAFLQVSLSQIRAAGGGVSIVATFADATELKTLEAQFVQSQKMQAVGQLAGGVAHDFNNLLTAISGHCDLLLHRHEQGDADWADLNQVRQNANRAASLVRQLLAFSRKQTLRPRVVNLTDALAEISHLLNRLLGERVTLRFHHAEELHRVRVDERQFEQVIMNLVVNARDAMKGEGTVTIRTVNERLPIERRVGRAVMPKGDYVRIDVSDDGQGIPSDKIEQIFEPFFTTKKPGEGTGLGLSTVYGIVKQTGGFIFAESPPGEGATFRIYLPRHEPEPTASTPTPPKRVRLSAEPDLTGSGVVLLIEDEAPVRAFAARALKLRGWEVLEASSGEEALEMLEDPTLHVDVLVSDVVMPGVDGPSCVREARKLRPKVKVVFVSGYAEEAMRRTMEGVPDCRFLAKPFSLNQLTTVVKECMTCQ